MEKISLVADFGSAMQFAVETRRGVLLRCAPLPSADSIDMGAIRDVMVALIDALGDREREANALRERLSEANDWIRETQERVASFKIEDEDEDD